MLVCPAEKQQHVAKMPQGIFETVPAALDIYSSLVWQHRRDYGGSRIAGLPVGPARSCKLQDHRLKRGEYDDETP
jgi:hypothetical protein